MSEYTEQQLIKGLKKAISEGNIKSVSEIEALLRAQRAQKAEQQDVAVLKETASDMPPFDAKTGEFLPETRQPTVEEEEPAWYDKALGAVETGLSLGTAATTGTLGGIAGAGSGGR